MNFTETYKNNLESVFKLFYIAGGNVRWDDHFGKMSDTIC